jgi:hypothetical protein
MSALPKPTPAITAGSQGSSDRSYAPIRSLTEMEETSSEYFTRKTSVEIETALSSGSLNIELGSPRQTRRLAWEAGIKEGYQRAFQSPVMETLIQELALLRKLTDALTTAGLEQERLAKFWNGKFMECVQHITRRK